MYRRGATVVFWVCCCLLVCSSVIAMLWPRVVFALVMPQAMGPPLLTSEQDVDDPGTLVVFDGAGELHFDMGTNIVLPIPALQRLLDKRRIAHFARNAKVAVWAQREGEPERRVGLWRASDGWKPTRDFPIRFELPSALDLPPGRYTVRAVVYADAPWGWGDQMSMAGSPNDQHLRPVLPGQFLIRSTEVGPLSVNISEPH